jgi:uncharacterized membrane protein YccC
VAQPKQGQGKILAVQVVVFLIVMVAVAAIRGGEAVRVGDLLFGALIAWGGVGLVAALMKRGVQE